MTFLNAECRSPKVAQSSWAEWTAASDGKWGAMSKESFAPNCCVAEANPQQTSSAGIAAWHEDDPASTWHDQKYILLSNMLSPKLAVETA